jgi:hypothetical protein
MAELLKRSTELFLDETTAPVLDPGRGRTKTGYLWALARDGEPLERHWSERQWRTRWGGADPPGLVYHYAPGRGAEHAAAVLDGYSGVLQVDGYRAYKTERDARGDNRRLALAHCWAHGRRRLREIFDRDASPIAEEGLRRIAELYRIEARHRRHDARGAPRRPPGALQAAGRGLRRLAGPRPRQGLGAIAHGREARLLRQPLGRPHRLSRHGRVEMDSNAVENLIRPVTLQRKNSLFAGHDVGAANWACVASLIETCKINGVDPFAYIVATLEAITAGHPKSRIDDLTPWAFAAASTGQR